MKNQFKIIRIAVLTLGLSLMMLFKVNAQVGIGTNTPNANSLLELESSTKGVLFPRVALTGTANVAPLAAHVQGMTVYNTATAGDVTPGMYTNSGTAWVKLGESSSSSALNVTAVQTGSYTALATDDIILFSLTAAVTLTLPTTGIPIGKKYYVSVVGTADITPSPLPRESQYTVLPANSSATYMYLGGTGIGSWSLISGY